MKNIILVTHGDFAKGILTSLDLVVGKTENIDFVSISARETIPDITAMIDAKIEGFHNDACTVIISDIAGGSTTRAAMELLVRRKNIYLITGLNLGLLLEVALLPLSGEDSSDRQALKYAIESSKSTMSLVNDIMDEQDFSQMSDLEEL
ncbi:PTS system mannose-specific EIIAB component [Clostridium sp. C105KSO15]|nr:PTS system mannose-specific EIIAB component [Clostridium sp. C105KSO15]